MAINSLAYKLVFALLVHTLLFSLSFFRCRTLAAASCQQLNRTRQTHLRGCEIAEALTMSVVFQHFC